jgi:hypothetical protein
MKKLLKTLINEIVKEQLEELGFLFGPRDEKPFVRSRPTTYDDSSGGYGTDGYYDIGYDDYDGVDGDM